MVILRKLILSNYFPSIIAYCLRIQITCIICDETKAEILRMERLNRANQHTNAQINATHVKKE